MKAQFAACILPVIQPCLGDETLFTCWGGNMHSYNAEGGFLETCPGDRGKKGHDKVQEPLEPLRS
jgi:hypothetical protein